MKVGAPVDLADLAARRARRQVMHEATDRIMDAITALVEELRGERARRPSGSTRAQAGVTRDRQPAQDDSREKS